MQQIQEIVISGAMGILTILAGIVVKAVKEFLIAKGGEKSIKIVELLAKNAVNAVEQVSKETGYKGEEKLSQAKGAVLNELEKYNIYMPKKDLDLYIESAVKQMESNWKGGK